ncbi:hypothetical protein [Knoellia sinensis]|nr:hypothetical protein [Knoellia sinensis]
MTSVTGVEASEPAAARVGSARAGTWTRWSIALASTLAGAIHLGVAPAYYREWWVFGVFFIVLGLFQVGFAEVILRRVSVPLVVVGITTNLMVVLIYLMTRTVGIPLGASRGSPAAGGSGVEGSGVEGSGHGGGHGQGPMLGQRISDGERVEAVGLPDLAATSSELLVVCLLATLLPGRERKVAVNVLLGVALLLWGVRLSGVFS